MNYVKGIYTKELFHNEKNGYTVGVLKLTETDVLELKEKVNVYFVGSFYDLKYRNNYTMHGNLVKHPKYGTQFNVSSYEVTIPEKVDELVEFLSSDLFPIGEKTAKKIVDLYKEDTIKKIIDNPNCLLLIPRLNEKRIAKIHDVLVDFKYTSEIVLELTRIGFETKTSLSLLNKYKTKITKIIEDNIYSLIEDNDLSFIEIDNIAKNMEIDENDERRLRALIVHLIENITFDKGDTYLKIEDIYNHIINYSSISFEELEYILVKMNKDKIIIIENKKYYLKKYYEAEKYIANKICLLNNMEINEIVKLDYYLEQLEIANNIKYDDIQKKAIKRAINNNLTIITGGPGTGKTTIIKAIVGLLKDIYKAKEEEIALLAPTGRAAKKMMETTDLPAYTIHKYLSWDKETNVFSVDENNKNKEKYIIVDETSMIDTILMSSLLKGTVDDIKLILVGDYYQLPSVGQGQVLKDLIDCEMFDVIKLNNLYRQNEESYIISLAYEIKNKELSENFVVKKDDYNFVECPNEQILDVVEDIVRRATLKEYTENDIQVLAPMYKSINGIDNLNKRLQSIFNPENSNKNELSYGDVIYREGDKVLQLINDADNNVYNGDIGYIAKIKKNPNEVIINFDDNLVSYKSDKLINIRHGYAISIHKAQGNEFKMVIIPFCNSFKRMLYNKLVYTAITRAKSKLILIGDRLSFIYGVNNDYDQERNTTLKEIIKDEYNN